MAPAEKSNSAKLRANEKKWGKTLMDSGWTVIPSIILEKQAALGLDALDINILMHLLIYWWEADNHPHPSKDTIAKALGVSTKTVQRHIAGMEKAGFVKRIPQYNSAGGQWNNRYSFDGLIKYATGYAGEKLGQREKHKAERKELRTRKGKPKEAKSSDTQN